jgi:8-oxo-dGTP diphosphatase
MRLIEKVVAYITHDDRLLVFRHTAFPEAGIQVPAGTLEPGESPESAVLREALEETGLRGLKIQAYLGSVDYDLLPFGEAGELRRHYFHIQTTEPPPELWRHDERDPSDGSPGPIEFEFFWVVFPAEVPPLSGRLGDLLHKIVW